MSMARFCAWTGAVEMKKPKNAEAAREEEAGKPAKDPGWADIDPTFLAGNRSPAPAFPLAALSARFRARVSGIATSRQVNLDLVTASALAITAGAVGNRVRLEITERRTEP